METTLQKILNQTYEEETALTKAFYSYDVELVKYLMSKGAKLGKSQGAHTLLLQLANHTNANTLELQVKTQDKLSAALIDWAVKAGADINVLEKHTKRNGLFYSIKKDYYLTSQKLIHNGISINHGDKAGITPFLQAIHDREKPKWIKLLLDNGADPRIGTSDQEGLIAKICALYEHSSSCYEIVRMVVEKIEEYSE